MSNTITGRLSVIKPTQVVSEKFSKREFVIETQEQYPQLVQLEFNQDKCPLLDSYATGQEVEVGYNLRGRSWQAPSGETKYFNTLQAWSIRRVGGTTESVNLKDVDTTPLHTPNPTQYPSGTIGVEIRNDLPF